MRSLFLQVFSFLLSLLSRFKIFTSSLSFRVYGCLWAVTDYLANLFKAVGEQFEKLAVKLTVSFISHWPTMQVFLLQKLYQTVNIVWLLGLGLLLNKFAPPVPIAACLILVLAFYYFLRRD